jgi:hypothetical protein
MRAVTGNNFGDVGAQALAKALECNRTLTTLDLGGACFTAAIIAVLVVAVCFDVGCGVVVYTTRC